MTTPAGLPTQERIFNFIVQFKRMHDGNSPSIRQIMDGCELRSTSYVSFALTKLISEGRIFIKQNKGESRMICVNGGQWVFMDSSTRQQ